MDQRSPYGFSSTTGLFEPGDFCSLFLPAGGGAADFCGRFPRGATRGRLFGSGGRGARFGAGGHRHAGRGPRPATRRPRAERSGSAQPAPFRARSSDRTGRLGVRLGMPLLEEPVASTGADQEHCQNQKRHRAAAAPRRDLRARAPHGGARRRGRRRHELRHGGGMGRRGGRQRRHRDRRQLGGGGSRASSAPGSRSAPCRAEGRPSAGGARRCHEVPSAASSCPIAAACPRIAIFRWSISLAKCWRSILGDLVRVGERTARDGSALELGGHLTRRRVAAVRIALEGAHAHRLERGRHVGRVGCAAGRSGSR